MIALFVAVTLGVGAISDGQYPMIRGLTCY